MSYTLRSFLSIHSLLTNLFNCRIVLNFLPQLFVLNYQAQFQDAAQGQGPVPQAPFRGPGGRAQQDEAGEDRRRVSERGQRELHDTRQPGAFGGDAAQVGQMPVGVGQSRRRVYARVLHPSQKHEGRRWFFLCFSVFVCHKIIFLMFFGFDIFYSCLKPIPTLALYL